MYLKSLKIGNIILENNIFLAPMAGITDLPFRKLCKEYGPGLVFTEMVSAKGMYYNDLKTNQLLDTNGEERPIAMQIFGSDCESMAVASQKVSKLADIVDINMGCPAPKVVKNGDGSKLLLNLELAKEIMTTVVENSSKPVSIKIRKGWDKNNIVATEIAKIAENVGVSMITVHGRTREDYYSGQVDLECIKEVKQAVKIPVIGNGDIRSEEEAKKMFEYTGVDGIMIGRASMGNPWIFQKVIHYLKTGNKLEEISPEEKLKVIIAHIEMMCNIKDEKYAIKEMRKHLIWYVKNLKNSSKIREKINTIEEKEEMIKYLTEYFGTL